MSLARVRTWASSSTTRMVSIWGPILPPSAGFLALASSHRACAQTHEAPRWFPGPPSLDSLAGPDLESRHEKVDRRPESGLAPLVRLVRDRQGQPARHHR